MTSEAWSFDDVEDDDDEPTARELTDGERLVTLREIVDHLSTSTWKHANAVLTAFEFPAVHPTSRVRSLTR